jgi:hypothetical protein
MQYKFTPSADIAAARLLQARRQPDDPAEDTALDAATAESVRRLAVACASNPDHYLELERAITAVPPARVAHLLRNLQLPYGLLSSLPSCVGNPPLLSATLRLLAAITRGRADSFSECAASLPGFYPALFAICREGDAESACWAARLLANLQQLSPHSATFAVKAHGLHALFASLLAREDAATTEALAVVLKRSVPHASAEDAAALGEMALALFAGPCEGAWFCALRMLAKLICVSEGHLLAVEGVGALLGSVRFLQEGGRCQVAALRLFVSVIYADVPEVIVRLSQAGLTAALYHPLTTAPPCLQVTVGNLIIKLLASDPDFLEVFVQSPIVECLCEMVGSDAYQVRSTVIRAICELFYCDHNIDLWQRIANAGGVESLVDCLPDVSPRKACRVMNAFSHIMAKCPEMLADLRGRIYEALDAICDDPINQDRDDLLRVAHGLNADLMDAFGDGDDGRV